MNHIHSFFRSTAIAAVAALAATQSFAADCSAMPTQAQLKSALVAAVATETSGLDFQMWATVVNRDGEVGAVGVSGDTSCADHNIAWRVRANLLLDYVNNGPAKIFAGDAAHPDNIIFDITPNPNGGTGNSASGFGHATCLNTAGSSGLPSVH